MNHDFETVKHKKKKKKTINDNMEEDTMSEGKRL